MLSRNNFTEQGQSWNEKMPTQDVFAVIFPVAMSTWDVFGLSFTALCVNDGSKSTHQYKDEYQCGGQSNHKIMVSLRTVWKYITEINSAGQLGKEIINTSENDARENSWWGQICKEPEGFVLQGYPL